MPTIPVTPVEPVTGLPQGTDDYPWWNDTVFYEIFVRSFYDSDGDGIGDFNGLTSKLDYLNDGDPNTSTDLGVTGLWLMPIHPSPSYHGYDVTDYHAVNPEYGTMDDFKRLFAVFGFENSEALLRQIVLDQLTNIGLVLDDQNLLSRLYHKLLNRRGQLFHVANALAFSHEDHHFRDVGGVVGHALEVFRN